MKAFSNEKNITTTFCFKLLGCKFIRINPDAENYKIMIFLFRLVKYGFPLINQIKKNQKKKKKLK